MAHRKRPQRKQRGHGSGLPAGFAWRDGRPRWIAQPALREAGWKGGDLKSPRGEWLDFPAAIARAQEIAAAVAAWRDGAPVPAGVEAFAPPSTAVAPLAGGKLDPRSIGALLDAYLGVPGEKRGEWVKEPSREFKKIKNQVDRRSKLNRFVDVLAGYPVKPGRDATAKDLAAYQLARERARRWSIYHLEPPPFDPRADLDDEAGGDILTAVYLRLLDEVGHNMAHGVLSDVSAWLEWCVAPKRAIPANWAKLVKRETPEGRIRVGDWDELAIMVEAAEDMGLPSIADAVILGADLSWSQVDRLAILHSDIRDDRVKGKRKKTGRRGDTPLLETLGKPRLAKIRERQAAIYGANVQPTHVIICEATGRPWTTDNYRHRFADVRAHAVAMARRRAAEANDPEAAARWTRIAQSLPDFRDQDLRDTAVTVAYDAGLNPQEIASRTLHSLKRIQDVLEKHYGEISQYVADQGARKLDDHLKALGVRL